MNEFFSINRYNKLVSKELTEKLPVYIKNAAFFSLLLFGYWLSILIFRGDPIQINTRISYLRFALFITMIIAPFNLYKNFNHSKKGIDYIILPASTAEKFLSMFTNTVIFFPLFTLLAILLADSLLATVTPKMFPGYSITGLYDNFRMFGGIIEALIFQLGCVFGNFLFRKNKIFKTLLTGAGLYIILAFIVLILLTVLFKDQFEVMNKTNTVIRIGSMSDFTNIAGNGKMTGVLQWLYNFGKVTIYGIFPIVFIAGTYYKMKTQQY